MQPIKHSFFFFPEPKLSIEVISPVLSEMITISHANNSSRCPDGSMIRALDYHAKDCGLNFTGGRGIYINLECRIPNRRLSCEWIPTWVLSQINFSYRYDIVYPYDLEWSVLTRLKAQIGQGCFSNNYNEQLFQDFSWHK